MKRLSIGEISKRFSSEGCILLEGQTYCGNESPLQYVCSCGKQSMTTWARFRRGSRCVQCGKSKADAKKRSDLSYVKNCFTDRGCELLDENYVNNYTPLRFRCSCGNVSVIRLFALLKGQRCDKCGIKKGDQHYRWNSDREMVELNRVLQRRSRHLLSYSLKQTGQSKTHKKAYMLGYSPRQLREHLESFPDWDRLKKGDWHIDHIFPVKAFVDHMLLDIKLINCLDNLRPISAKANLIKNGRYNEDEFMNWLKIHNVPLI